jgi:hypothetical protein
VQRPDEQGVVGDADLGADAARIREQVAALPPSTAPADQPKPPPPFPLLTRDPAHGNDSS